MNITSKIIGAAFAATLLAGCNTTEQRIAGAGVGAGTGAIIAGPVGAVAGGVVGAVYAPRVARETRRPVRKRYVRPAY